jgi:hypothetical protein
MSKGRVESMATHLHSSSLPNAFPAPVSRRSHGLVFDAKRVL